MNPRPASVLLTALAAGALSLTGCGQPAVPQAGRPAVDRVTVVTSTDVYASVATAVAGDRATVTPLITSPDADPHEYESTAKDAASVGGAKVLVANGGGYDDFAAKLVESAPVKPAVIDVSELSGLEPAEGTAEAGGEAHGPQEASHAPGEEPGGEEHAHGGFNEHVWYHLPTMAKLADRLAADLSTADPAGGASFTANAGAFKARLDGLNGRLAAVKATHAGQRVALTEPVAGYLVEAAGLVNATPEEFTEAAEEGNDPPAAVLNQTLELFRADPVRALLLNPQAQNAATKQVEEAARAAGVPVVTMTETLPAGVTDYVAWMGGQVDQLTAAMDRR